MYIHMHVCACIYIYICTYRCAYVNIQTQNLLLKPCFCIGTYISTNVCPCAGIRKRIRSTHIYTHKHTCFTILLWHLGNVERVRLLLDLLKLAGSPSAGPDPSKPMCPGLLARLAGSLNYQMHQSWVVSCAADAASTTEFEICSQSSCAAVRHHLNSVYRWSGSPHSQFRGLGCKNGS